MISATRFATRFTSFWLECLGPMAYFFVQDANRRSQVIFPPIKGLSDAKNHGRIGEVACQLYEASLRDPALLRNKRRAFSAIERTLDFAASEFDRSAKSVDPELGTLGQIEKNETVEVACRISAFVAQYGLGKSVIASPRFQGCGFVDQSRGDLILGDTLYEIKAAARNYLLTDFRQLLVYLALNASAGSYDIKRVGLFNPRTGDHFDLPAEVFAASISGKHSAELFSEILEFISGGGVSR